MRVPRIITSKVLRWHAVERKYPNVARIGPRRPVVRHSIPRAAFKLAVRTRTRGERAEPLPVGSLRGRVQPNVGGPRAAHSAQEAQPI